LAFVDDKSRKVVRVPDILFDKISKHL